MLNMGFLDSINEILEEVPASRRTLLFSATMSKEIASIARNYMQDPEEVTIGTRNASADNVSHCYYLVHAKDKYKVLKRIADYEPDIYGIIFCRTRKDTQEVASRLINDGYNADALHGDLSQAQRDAVMLKFRSHNLSLLVATDVAARGLDVDDLTHVINFSLPEDTEVYTHRCGRTGRAGKTGISISIVHLKEKQNLHKIEKLLKKSFEAIPVPTGSEICRKQLLNWVDKLEKVSTDHQEIEKLLPEIEQKLEGTDREMLIRKVVSLEFNRFLDDYRSDNDSIETFTETETSSWRTGKESGRGNGHGSFKRLFINLGKSDNFYPDQLIELVNRNTKGKKVPIGKIDLLKGFSFFEVDSDSADFLIRTLNRTKFRNKNVIVEVAQEKDSKQNRGRNYAENNKSGKERANNKRRKEKFRRQAYKR